MTLWLAHFHPSWQQGIFTPVSSPFTLSSYIPTDAYSTWQGGNFRIPVALLTCLSWWIQICQTLITQVCSPVRVHRQYFYFLKCHLNPYVTLYVGVHDLHLPASGFLWVTTAFHLKLSVDLGHSFLYCSVSFLCYCFCNKWLASPVSTPIPPHPQRTSGSHFHLSRMLLNSSKVHPQWGVHHVCFLFMVFYRTVGFCE